MRIRSRPSSSLTKGEQSRQYQDNSEEDDVVVIYLDSDYVRICYEDEAQASGVDLTMEAAWPSITKRRRSYRPKGKQSIKTKEEKVEEKEHADWVMNEVGGGGNLQLMWKIWEEENDRWMAENNTTDLDFTSQNEFMTETAEPPSDLIMPLLRYQKEWLAWALKQEESTSRGGILADEMGMGKTVQVIALVLAKRAISDSILLTHAPCTSQEITTVKGTLVICPVVAVIHWVSEIDRSTTKGSNKILVYHGPNREKNIDNFAEYDFVITTYSTVETEYRKNVMPPKQECHLYGKSFYEKKLSMKKSILHSMKWNRIILDEAHYVKDIYNNTTRAILALESSYKWCLSGIILQNRVGELYSLVRFLQIIPYSYYFCEDCDCRVLDYRSFKCPHCHHKSVRHFCWWNRFISTPIQSQGSHGIGRNAMVLLNQKILKSISLRRTKKGRVADLALPPRIVTLCKYSLDVKEEEYYTSLYNESQAQFNIYIQDGTLMHNYAHIFYLLTRLRQVTSCTHFFCKSCLIDFSANVGQVSCPACSKPLTMDFNTNDKGVQKYKASIKGFRSSSILNRIRLDNFRTSTKMDALREEIRLMVERDGSAKAIVFSQFTSFLDLIHYSLQKSGVNCVQLDGSMTINARDSAITKFTNHPDCRIILMSLKVGGVALNLTMASHVFLMDPWWNFVVERQAQDRIHQIGQYKPIRIVRFVIENTIEERILELQKKKELVFEGMAGGTSGDLGKLTEEDLKFLFAT